MPQWLLILTIHNAWTLARLQASFSSWTCISSRSCTFCFWIWSQLHRAWKPGSPGHFYLMCTCRDRVERILVLRQMSRPQSLRIFQVQWGMARQDHQIEAEVKFLTGTSDHLSSTRFEVVDERFGVFRKFHLNSNWESPFLDIFGP